MGARRFGDLGLGTQLRLLLAALDGEVQAVYDAMGEPFRPRFYPVVRELRSTSGCTVGELAVRTGVSQPAMTQTLTEMRLRGLVTAASRRLVRLTEEGEALCKRLEPMWGAVEAAARELDDELPVSLSGPSQAKAEAIAAPAAAMNLDDKLEIARTAVSTDPKRVAQVVRDMVASDG